MTARTAGPGGRPSHGLEDAAITPTLGALKLTREGVCRAFNLRPELLEALEGGGVVAPGEDGAFDVADVAAALFNYGINRAKAADEKLAAVAHALNDTMPALQRLATLPEAPELEGEAKNKVTVELSAFFSAFSALLSKATEALKSEE